MKKIQKNNSGLSRRLHFPEDEKKLPWLPMLLDAYALADTGVAIALRDVEKKQGKKLACCEGCDVCCRQADIPLYPHELVGIYWYVSEKLAQQTKELVMRQCLSHAAGAPCPFLANHSCSIHPVRPVSCRQFNVFTETCAPGEDPYYSRREDVLVPLADYTDRAFAAVLPHYGIRTKQEEAQAVRLVRGRIMNLQAYDWRRLAAALVPDGRASDDAENGR